MFFLPYKAFPDGLCTVSIFGVIIALGCLSLFWRQLDPVKMIPDQCVSRPAKSLTFLCRRLRSIRHGRKTCGKLQTCRKHTLEDFRHDCLGGSSFAKPPLAKRVSPISPALGHQDRVGEMFRPTHCFWSSDVKRSGTAVPFATTAYNLSDTMCITEILYIVYI